MSNRVAGSYVETEKCKKPRLGPSLSKIEEAPLVTDHEWRKEHHLPATVQDSVPPGALVQAAQDAGPRQTQKTEPELHLLLLAVA